MSYIEGLVLAVPAAKKDAYRDFASRASELFREYGATRVVECWGDDVPDGKVTDFKRAVQAEPNEIVVFSWVEYPSKSVRDSAVAKMMSDSRMQNLGDMPFDGKRVIIGGFATLLDAS